MVSAGEIGLGTDPARPGRQIVRLAKRIGGDAANREVCFQAITETAARLPDVERVGIWLYDTTHGHVECADMFETGDAKHSRGLSLDAARFPACIKFDPSQFEDVVLALARNARDAMPQGGELKIHVRELRAQDTIEWIELLVSDGGDGIPPEVLPLIFEPFYSTKSMGTGWGLGLATVQRLVESAGGHIFVRSEPEQGTAFRVRLPAVQVAEQAPAAATILVCEDESRILAMLEQTLEEAGYEVLAARDSAGELRRNGVSVEGHRLMAKPFNSADVLRHVRDELVRARGRGTTR